MIVIVVRVVAAVLCHLCVRVRVCECVASTPCQVSICRCQFVQMIRVLVLRHQNWLVMQWLFIGLVSIYVVCYGKFWSIQIVDHCTELVRLDK